MERIHANGPWHDSYRQSAPAIDMPYLREHDGILEFHKLRGRIERSYAHLQRLHALQRVEVGRLSCLRIQVKDYM